MLQRVKLAMRISTDVYDSELLGLIAAGIADLENVGATVEHTMTTGTGGAVTNYTINDPLPATAVVTYCRMMFGSPSDFDRLKEAYEMQKGQLRENHRYGMEAL